jgi:hypothetical protein
MKLVRICKVEYGDKEQVIIPESARMRYDLYFIDNDDYLWIDEDDYTQEKFEARLMERTAKRFDVYKDNGNGLQQTGYVYCPYIPLQNIKLEFEITKDGVTFT